MTGMEPSHRYFVCAYMSLCACICVLCFWCVCVVYMCEVYVCVFVWCMWGVCVCRPVNEVSLWSGSCYISEPGWPTNPRDFLVFASSELGLQIHNIMPLLFFKRGSKLISSCMSICYAVRWLTPHTPKWVVNALDALCTSWLASTFGHHFGWLTMLRRF